MRELKKVFVNGFNKEFFNMIFAVVFVVILRYLININLLTF
jgi:hypothetical protein